MLTFWTLLGQMQALAQLQLPGRIRSVMFSTSSCSFTAVQDNKHRDTGRETETPLYENRVRDLPLSLLNGLFSFVVREPWWLSPPDTALATPPKRPPTRLSRWVPERGRQPDGKCPLHWCPCPAPPAPQPPRLSKCFLFVFVWFSFWPSAPEEAEPWWQSSQARNNKN